MRGGSAEEVRRSREKRAFSDSIGKMGVSEGDSEKDEETNRRGRESVRGLK